MKQIVREKYLNRIIDLNGTPDIKIITGIRRSGKSRLMQSYMEYLREFITDSNIIFVDFVSVVSIAYISKLVNSSFSKLKN